MQPLAQNALYCLENGCKNEISVEGLPAELGVSASHLDAAFQKQTGMSPEARLTRSA